MQEYINLIIGVMGGGTLLTVIVTQWFSKKITDKEIESIVVKNYETIIDRLVKEVDRLNARIDAMQDNESQLMEQKTDLEHRVMLLEADNKELRNTIEQLTRGQNA